MDAIRELSTKKENNMKKTLITLTVLLGIVAIGGLLYTEYNSDTVIDAADAGANYFDNLGAEWVQADFMVTLGELEVLIANAKLEGLDYLPTTVAYDTDKGELKVGYKPLGLITTTLELYGCLCDNPIVEIP